jgi:hypothetical protein
MIRLTIAESVGGENVYARSHRFYNPGKTHTYHVVKIHEYDNYLARRCSHVFSCYRDGGEQRRSIKRFRKIVKNQNLTESELDEFIQHDLNRFNRWKNNKKFIKAFKFEDLINNKEIVIKELCRILKLKNVEPKRVIERINNLELPKSKFDKETCLTAKHFTSEEFK